MSLGMQTTFRRHAWLAAFALTCALAPAQAAPQISMVTSKGTIVLELDSLKAPITVANFMEYARSGFYGGTIFHRVIKNFVIQGGGHTEDLTLKPTRPAIRNEANNGLKNARGTIAMARDPKPHTATSQFYINLVNNVNLDFKDTATASGWGYCVFGKVVSGMNVVDSIAVVPTALKNGMADVPITPILVSQVSGVPTGLIAPGKIRSPASLVVYGLDGRRIDGRFLRTGR